MTPPQDALWAAIRARPRDLQPRHDLARQLAREGDPLGQVIAAALAHAAEKDRVARRPLEARLNQLFDARKEPWFEKPPWFDREIGVGWVMEGGVPDALELTNQESDRLACARWWTAHYPLRELRFTFCDPAPVLAALAQDGHLARVESMVLNQCPLTAECATALQAAAPGLAGLRMHALAADPGPLASLLTARGLASLERVHLTGAPLDRAEVHALAGLSSLRSLTLLESTVAEVDLSLSPSPRRALETIEIEGGFSEQQLFQIFKLLDGLALAELRLRKAGLTEWFMRALSSAAAQRKLQGLRVLDLRNNALDDTAMVVLRMADLPALKVLRLDCNRIGPEGLKALAASRWAQQLEELGVGENELWSGRSQEFYDSSYGEPVGSYALRMTPDEVREKFGLPASLVLV